MNENNDNEFAGKSDHDVLLLVARDVRWLKKIVGNHIKHHWAITSVLIMAVVALITALIYKL